MTCELVGSTNDFLEIAGCFLARREAENTVLLGTALRCRRKPKSDAVMAVVRDGDVVRLAAIMAPPDAMAVSAGDPEAMPCLVAALRRAAVRPPGVSGLEPMAERFAALWQDDPAAEAALRMTLYRSNRITAPGDVPGELRTADAADLEWLAAWQRRFAEHASLSAAEQATDMRAIVAARLARGEMHFWAVEGAPVSSAAFTPTTPAGDAGRINAVFTPEQERGKGYASACVAALSQRLLDRGWRYCLVFADRANPTTNRIYPRLGFREIAPFATIGLDRT